MPISPIVLQRRHAELGRIRLGAKRNGNGAPMKLEQFRFTSHSERYIRDLAELYGGEAREWDNNGVPSWEVYTTSTSVPVIAVKGGLSQWMETWSGGGCVHRCDGERGADGDLCNPDDRAHQNAKPTTRLSVMLPELEAIGVWRMESHGWNAAAEIPAVAELAQFVGDLVPANLHLVERRSVKDGKTSRFVVPVLDLQIGTARLREIVAAKSGTAELEAPPSTDRPALAAAPDTAADTAHRSTPEQAEPAAGPSIPTPEQITAADATLLQQMVTYLEGNGLADHPATNAARSRLSDLTASTEPTQSAAPDADGAVPADPEADAIWQQILATGGLQGMSLADVEDDFSQRMGGLMSADASAAELQNYLDQLTKGAAA